MFIPYGCEDFMKGDYLMWDSSCDNFVGVFDDEEYERNFEGEARNEDMGDLISRKEVIKIIDELGYINCHDNRDFQVNNRVDKIRQKIVEQPTAFDVGKVIAELEQQKNQYFRRGKEIEDKFGENYESQKNFAKACSYDHALEILKSATNAKNGKTGG